MSTIIITDSNCDFTEEYLKENNNPVIPFSFILDGKEYMDDFGKSLSYENFYTEMVNGKMSTTSQINPYTFEEMFKKYLDEGYDVIYLGFSSNLSQTFTNALSTKNMLIDENPNYKLAVVDSLSATSGQAFLLDKANQLNKNGKSFEEIVEWLENNKTNVNIWFTVDDLDHLKRGGRISATSAALGSMISVKPILNVSDEGKLVAKKKIRGRKKALKKLIEEMEERIIDVSNQTIFINHGNCLDEAESLKTMILEKFDTKVEVNFIGPVIGSHTGQGVIAIAYFGKPRD
jgi:DegV family protein with EDD domain